MSADCVPRSLCLCSLILIARASGGRSSNKNNRFGGVANFAIHREVRRSGLIESGIQDRNQKETKGGEEAVNKCLSAWWRGR